MANFFKSLLFGESEDNEEEKAKKNFDVLKYDGIRAAKIGKTTYAIRCFNEALKIHEDVEIREHLISAYTRENRLEEAEKTAGFLLGIEPDNIEILLLRAKLNYMLEAYDKVIEDCHHVIELDDAEIRAHYLAGCAKHKNGDRIGAVVNLSKALAIKEDFTEACLLRGELMVETGDYADGLADAEKVIQLLPEDEQAYMLRGRCHEALKEYESAEKDFKYVIELNPFNEQAYLALGRLYISRDQLDKATDLFDEAIELEPDFAEAYKERGRVCLMQGDKEASFADMKKALELDPHSKESKLINGKYSNFEDMYKNRPL